MDIYSYLGEYIDFLEKKLIFDGHDLRDIKIEFHYKLRQKFDEEKNF